MGQQTLAELFAGIMVGVRDEPESGSSSGKASSLSIGACPLPHCSSGGLRSVDQQHRRHLVPCAAS